MKMITDKKKNRLQAISAVLAVVIFYAVLQGFGITCPIKWITGISCAGCGMTRAYLALLHLDLVAAFHYHPLFWMVPILIVVLWKKQKIKSRYYKIIVFTAVLMLVTIYLYRMLQGNGSIVVFKPEDGAIIRFLNNIFT